MHQVYYRVTWIQGHMHEVLNKIYLQIFLHE